MTKDFKTASKLSGALFLSSLAFASGATISSLLEVKDIGSAVYLRNKLLEESSFGLNSDKNLEMNCGAGKCGSKMGDHTCAGVKKNTPPITTSKVTEGKCGEGKCGGKCKCEKHGTNLKSSDKKATRSSLKMKKKD